MTSLCPDRPLETQERSLEGSSSYLQTVRAEIHIILVYKYNNYDSFTLLSVLYVE